MNVGSVIFYNSSAPTGKLSSSHVGLLLCILIFKNKTSYCIPDGKRAAAGEEEQRRCPEQGQTLPWLGGK